MKKGITNALLYPKSSTMREGWKGNEPSQFATPVFSAASNDKSPTVPKAENLKTPHLQKQIFKKTNNQLTEGVADNQAPRHNENLSLVCYGLLWLH